MWKVLLLWGFLSMAADAPKTLEQFHQDREASLKKNWLVVAGLTWLKPGANTVGHDKKADVVLPAPVPEKLGTITFADKKASIVFKTARHGHDVIKLDGKPVQAGKSYELTPDTKPNTTVIDVAGVEFFTIERPNGTGIRIKDPNAETLKNFKGLAWYPENKNLIVEGQWKPLNPPKTLRIPDVLGNITDEKIEGSVVFKIAGQDIELFPAREGDDLEFMFKDATSGKDSYGTGRFLTAKVEKDGRVLMDFNRAYNPPCAYIHYATCPMPAAENILKVAIAAGEKTPPGHH